MPRERCLAITGFAIYHRPYRQGRCDAAAQWQGSDLEAHAVGVIPKGAARLGRRLCIAQDGSAMNNVVTNIEGQRHIACQTVSAQQAAQRPPAPTENAYYGLFISDGVFRAIRGKPGTEPRADDLLSRTVSSARCICAR